MMRLFVMICALGMIGQGCKSSGSPSVKVSEVPSQPVQSPISRAAPIAPNSSSADQAKADREALAKAEEEIWKSRSERDRAEAELAQAQKDAKNLAEHRAAQDRARAERERLNDLIKTPPPAEVQPIPDITITTLYNFGRLYYSGLGSLEGKQDSYSFPKPDFELLVSRGLSCELKAISETIYSCDYRALGGNNMGSNCKDACWTHLEGYGCRECYKPSLTGGRENIPASFNPI